MSFIDRTYFDGSLILPVSSEPLRAAIDAAIAEYEEDYLRKALGPSLYVAFMAGIAEDESGFSDMFSDRFFHGTLEDRWKWIRDGHTWSYNGKTRIWIGLINSRKLSPVADYVYWKYRAMNSTQTGSLGETAAKSENADRVSPMRKMVTAWNNMVDRTKELGLMCQYLNAGVTYPEFVPSELDVDVYEYQNIFNI